MAFKGMVILFILLMFLGTQNTQSAFDQEESSRGKKLYIGHCALCHGVDGSGGRGPVLTQAWLRRQANARAVFNTIRSGVEGGEMPAFWLLSDNEIWDIIRFVREMNSSSNAKLPGDAEKGKALFLSKGNCNACHIVNGAGTGIGPDLSTIGGRRNAIYLRESLIDPGKSLPEGFLVVSMILKDGKKIRGVRVNEDSFTIQIHDASRRLHSYRKDELKELRKEFGVSTMPGYRDILTDSELDDLVAYLAGLREPR